MSSTLTIPPQVVPRVREGAHLQLAQRANEIRHTAEAFEKDQPPLESRADMERTWALLDILGWAGHVPPSIELDMHKHSTALIAALDAIVPDMARWLSEMSDEDERKSDREDEYLAIREFETTARSAVKRAEKPPTVHTLMIPPTLIERVREGVYGLLVVAAEDITRSAHAHTQPEPETRPQLDRAWTLLNWLGWIAHDEDVERMLELPVAEHGETLLAALDVTTRLLAEWLDDTDPDDPQKPRKADELQLMRQFHRRAQHAVSGAGS